ncbi:MAG: lysylphosphatidylglycerol synthase transmembrane domain-containing protein [Thermodesulfobacteriota bacterium]|nr:lysylphosphatidylglycerol synthase transmembrane domain-containing protein [Thermodesulfobacteriota bacterium]
MKQRTIKNNTLKLGIGFVFSIIFLFIAFRQVDLQKLLEVLRGSNSNLLMLAIFVMFLSHWFRAMRHSYLLESVEQIENKTLFSALMIGYMANTILPAHLGEFLRAYVIGKKERISGSAVFATIVVERILDVLSLLLIMGLIIMVYPFPGAVKISAYLTFAFAIGIIGFLAILKLNSELTLRFVKIIVKPFPKKIASKIFELIDSFSEGIVALKDRKSYFFVFILSIVIWVCYACFFTIGFYAFDFVALYNLPIGASFVVLVITTISILVPSSPGYIGTYHWLCMISLSLFAIPESPALGYAIVMHALSTIPIAIVGIVFALKEGINISNVRTHGELQEVTVTD